MLTKKSSIRVALPKLIKNLDKNIEKIKEFQENICYSERIRDDKYDDIVRDTDFLAKTINIYQQQLLIN